MDNAQRTRSVPEPIFEAKERNSTEEEKEKSYPVLLDALRDKYMSYQDTKNRCQFVVKPKGIGEQFQRFYYAPKIPFLQAPDVQKQYRDEFVAEVTRLPEPKPLYLLADQLQYDQLETIADRSDPTTTKSELIKFYQMRNVELSRKKKILLKRWANMCMRANVLDQNSETIDKSIAYLQIEQDSVANRLMRLEHDDNYKQAQTMDRPQPSTNVTQPDTKSLYKEDGKALLYQESSEKFIGSNLRLDDFEVYIRRQTYLNRINRSGQKLISKLKWFCAEKKYEIWGQSRDLMFSSKQNILQARFKIKFSVMEEVKKKLNALGTYDDKAISSVTERYIYHLKEPEFVSRKEKIMNSHKFEHVEPKKLFASNTELKIFLKQLSNEFGLNFSQAEIDNGQQFTYQLQTFFPVEFEKQTQAMTFDYEDTGCNSDHTILDRLTRSLGLSKDTMLSEMSELAKQQRHKSILTALNVGKTGATDQTLKELTESELNKDQVIRHNLIRKLRTIEFFSLNETDTKIRRADWLDLVCWQVNVHVKVQKQNQLLSSQENHIDRLLSSAFEFLEVNDQYTVNKVLEDSAQVHLTKIQDIQKRIASGLPAFKPIKSNFHSNQAEAVTTSLILATNPEIVRQQDLEKDQELNQTQNFQNKSFEKLPGVDSLSMNLMKCFYSLRLVKTRNLKIQLLHIMNYFRAVQKILANDILEFNTRQRAMGEQKDVIDPHFGKTAKGVAITKLQGPTGPGDVFNQSVERELDAMPIQKDPLTLKSFKYQNSFDPIVISTCPVVSKHHRTFGQPKQFEKVSSETQRQKTQPNTEFTRHLHSEKDQIIVEEATKQIFVLNEFGIKIVYQEAVQDLAELENEMLRIGSLYINNYEYVLAMNEVLDKEGAQRPSSLIDRAEMVLDLYSAEVEFQFQKVLLIQTVLQAYKHIVDPVEHVRICQIIVDTMAQRPRLNLESNLFNESYESETQVILTRKELFQEFLDLQTEIENKENLKQQNYIEAKVRKLQESQEEFWQIKQELAKIQTVGCDENSVDEGDNLDNVLKEKMRQVSQQKKEMQDKLKQIAQRHITEFANEQHTDFASVLGLPEITLELLYNKFDQQEPIVTDSIRESAFFSKMVEGYPDKLGDNLTDIYQSYSLLPRFNAALQQLTTQIDDETQPENSFALSCLEVCLFREARMQLLQSRKDYYDGISSIDLKGQHLFEEDFYLGNSDGLMILMRQIIYETHPENLYTKSNPMVVANFDTTSVQNYNFPRITSKQVIDELVQEKVPEKFINERFTGKACQLAKKYIARPLVILNSEEKFTFEIEKKEVRPPSIMNMSCNIMEVLRLREEIIQRMHETNILANIYIKQCELAAKHNKITAPDDIQFEIQSLLSKDFVNLVDLNDGLCLDFDKKMPFMEFSPQLKAILDFKSDSCVKALCTNLGVEEMRAILHCQVMQQQLLTVAVRQNDILIDKPLKGLKELELFEKNISTPNSQFDLDQIITSPSDGPGGTSLKTEKSRLQQLVIKCLSDCIYLILSKKSKDRAQYQKKFTQALSILKNTVPQPKPELAIRLLRSFRIQLCHQYCQSALQEVHRDSIKIQTLQACNTLRIRALLLPKDSQIFQLGKGEFQENLSFKAYQHFQKHQALLTSINKSQMNIQSVLGGSGVCQNILYYVPTSEEICLLDRKSFNSEESQIQASLQSMMVLDQHLKTIILRPQLQDVNKEVYKLEGKQQYGVRKVWFKEAKNYIDSDSYSTLTYYHNILSIFDLNYIMMRNGSKGVQSLELETQSLAGICFWNDLENQFRRIEKYFIDYASHFEEKIENKAAFLVVQKINLRKNLWIDLNVDIQKFSDEMKKLDGWFKKLPQDRRQLSYVCDMLTLQHQCSYYKLLNGIENMVDYCIETEQDEFVQRLAHVRAQITRQNTNEIKLLTNGFFISQGTANPKSIELSSNQFKEYQLFYDQQMSQLDEQAMIPKQINVLRRVFGLQNQTNTRETLIGYNDLLLTAFYNMEDGLRNQLTSTFFDLDSIVSEYLVYKGLEQAPGDTKPFAEGKNHLQEKLLSEVEILSLKIEAANLERIQISWTIDGRELPKNTQDFKRCLRQIKNANMLAVLSQRDVLNSIYWQRNKKKPVVEQNQRQDVINMALYGQEAEDKSFSYINRVNLIRSEIVIYKQVLETNLVKIGIEIVDREHQALQNCLGSVMMESQIAAYVNPNQQFSSVQFHQVDKIPHLDVVTKVGYLQGFLTRLKNRCTEVETLTSGPGLVFSIKDFNECLGIFAKQLVKFGEEQLRQRCETANLREHQYHHFIYVKEMEALYYKAKCEQFLTNIDAIINSKMTSQGNQLIYELDVCARELRALKDHYYLMERCLREQISSEFNEKINIRDGQINNLKKANVEFRRDRTNELKLEIEGEIQGLGQKIKQMTGDTRRVKENKPNNGSGDNTELLQEISLLTKRLRQQRIFNAMRRTFEQEKHFQEMQKQKEQLTQNQSLWDQLAETEKREQVTNQELQLARQNLTHYERLIEKLYTQLEHINNQKQRLEEFKKSKSKRISELEAKMNDVQILENLDLNKILEELRSRDKKLSKMDQLEQNLDGRVEALDTQHRHQIEELKKQIQFERKAKQEAFEKLESMRIEMKTLEGKDSIKNDLWKSKCKELYEICKELERENATVKQSLLEIQSKKQVQSDQSSKITDVGSNYAMPATREAVILQRNHLKKPFTAQNGKRRMFSGVNHTHQTVDGYRQIDQVSSSLPGLKKPHQLVSPQVRNSAVLPQKMGGNMMAGTFVQSGEVQGGLAGQNFKNLLTQTK